MKSVNLDLQRVFEIEGSSEPFSGEIVFSQLHLPGGDRQLSQAKVQGVVKNSAGVVSVDYAASVTLTSLCDRCLAPVVLPLEFEFHHDLVLSLNRENDDYLVVPDARLDVDQLTQADVLLELPSKVLCQPDCKGLCEACGANLNRTSCGCGSQYLDPRLGVLDQLLEQE